MATEPCIRNTRDTWSERAKGFSLHGVMAKVDPRGLEETGGVGKARRTRRDKAFMSRLE